jgi:hypothetical protein
MARSAEGDQSENQLVDLDALRGNGLLHSAQVGAQVRVIAGLRVVYADLIAEPVPDRLLELIHEFETRASRHDR